MAAYFAKRIMADKLKYSDVINKYPEYKEDIDLILISDGFAHLIISTEPESNNK